MDLPLQWLRSELPFENWIGALLSEPKRLAVTALDDPQWYAVRVMIQREYVVAEMLRKQDVATFIPTEVRAHKRSSYSKGQADFAVPILPGMVFVGFPSAPAWYDVLDRNPLIVAPFSLGTEGTPTRLRMDRLLEFFSGVSDGCMVRDKEGLRLIHMPGRSPVRALDTRVKTISARRKAEKAKAKRPAKDAPPPTSPPPRKYADFLSRYVHGGSA